MMLFFFCDLRALRGVSWGVSRGRRSAAPGGREAHTARNSPPSAWEAACPLSRDSTLSAGCHPAGGNARRERDLEELCACA